MPLQNRVLPTGEIVAMPLRGAFMGNRSILHGEGRTLGAARWRHRAWICCALAFKDRHRTPMTPGRYTELFFHDEAVALAAGHRPCAECRRADHLRFLAAWERAHDARPKAAEIDRLLHAARIEPRTRRQRRHRTDIAALPDGAFILHGDSPALVLDDRLHPFGPEGYGAPLARPVTGEAEVLTPAPLVAVLVAGYVPKLHPSLAPQGGRHRALRKFAHQPLPAKERHETRSS